MTAWAGPERTERAQALVRRQVVLTLLTLAMVVAALALVRWVGASDPAPRVVRVVHDGRAQVHVARRGPTPAVMRLALAQLGLCAALALVALGHAARVIAFVFPRKAP